VTARPGSGRFSSRRVVGRAAYNVLSGSRGFTGRRSLGLTAFLEFTRGHSRRDISGHDTANITTRNHLLLSYQIPTGGRAKLANTALSSHTFYKGNGKPTNQRGA
jgi:hypothetical protein